MVLPHPQIQRIPENMADLQSFTDTGYCLKILSFNLSDATRTDTT
jgi:hypothetical protein